MVKFVANCALFGAIPLVFEAFKFVVPSFAAFGACFLLERIIVQAAVFSFPHFRIGLSGLEALLPAPVLRVFISSRLSVRGIGGVASLPVRRSALLSGSVLSTIGGRAALLWLSVNRVATASGHSALFLRVASALAEISSLFRRVSAVFDLSSVVGFGPWPIGISRGISGSLL